MGREIRNFRPNESIQINHRKFTFLERKTRPGKTHLQEGSQAIVAKVKDGDGKLYALKVFKAKYRKEAILERGNYLRKYASLPGMQAANNEIIDPSSVEYQQAIAKYPFLQYAILMPWVPTKPGTTWGALRSKQSLTRYSLPDKSKSLKRAKNLAKVINGLSSKSIAHCDLCPNNLVVDEDDNVYLIDLENYYHDTFPPPPWGCPAGQLGYRHKTIASLKNKQYNPFADLFAGALLIAEMLTWHDPKVRYISLNEMLFEQSELQTKSDSYQVVRRVIQETSKECGTLFEKAWFSKKLDECPSASEWMSALAGINSTGTEVPLTNMHTVSRRKPGQKTTSRKKSGQDRYSTASSTKSITEVPTQPISPHVIRRRRVTPSMQSHRHKPKASQPPKPVSQPPFQKPIIQTTSNAPQSNATGWLGGFGGLWAILLFLCLIIIILWLANQ